MLVIDCSLVVCFPGVFPAPSSYDAVGLSITSFRPLENIQFFDRQACEAQAKYYSLPSCKSKSNLSRDGGFVLSGECAGVLHSELPRQIRLDWSSVKYAAGNGFRHYDSLTRETAEAVA